MVTLYPRALSRCPRDAAVMPLPSDDTTPPVTKMCLAMPTFSFPRFPCPSSAGAARRASRGRPHMPDRRTALPQVAHHADWRVARPPLPCRRPGDGAVASRAPAGRPGAARPSASRKQKSAYKAFRPANAFRFYAQRVPPRRPGGRILHGGNTPRRSGRPRQGITRAVQQKAHAMPPSAAHDALTPRRRTDGGRAPSWRAIPRARSQARKNARNPRRRA